MEGAFVGRAAHQDELAAGAGGKVYVGTNNESPRDPRYKGDRSNLLCLDERTGELAWMLSVPKIGSGKVNDWENLGLLAAPLVVVATPRRHPGPGWLATSAGE